MQTSTDRIETVHNFVNHVFSEDLHAKRVLSLANAALGVVTGASLAVAMIGHALAQARGLADKHAIKQVDRLLSNQGVRVWDLFAPWIRHAVGERKTIVVAMDWTDFDADDQTTLALHLVTGHGRATPLLWLTVGKDELKNTRNDFEDLCLSRLKACLPDGVAVTILADRGFGDVKLFEFLQSLGFDYAIRFRGNIQVAAETGETRLAADWVGKGGRARMLRDVELTAARCKVPAVVCVHAKDMKEPWCIATSHHDAAVREIVNHYSRRWTGSSLFRVGKMPASESQFPERGAARRSRRWNLSEAASGDWYPARLLKQSIFSLHFSHFSLDEALLGPPRAGLLANWNRLSLVGLASACG